MRPTPSPGSCPTSTCRRPGQPTRSDYGEHDVARGARASCGASASMWFGLVSLTISSFLLGALGAWGIEFFKREHGLSATEAGGLRAAHRGRRRPRALGGGALADRLAAPAACQRPGARAGGGVGGRDRAARARAPRSTRCSSVAVLLLLGAACLTLPVAPSEALVSDVVPAAAPRAGVGHPRGIVRAPVRARPAASSAPLSDALDDDLRIALVVVHPALRRSAAS